MSYVDFTSRAVETFRKAASHDEAQEYAEAYRNYIEAIDIFMTAIKYEKKNDTKREMLRGKVKEILERAEKIKDYLNSTSMSNDTKSGTTSGLQSKDKTKKSTGNSNDDEDEKSRFRSGLETAIVHVKPNVPWSSIAGLDAAKDALREAVILPVRFPQLFKGNRKPWRAILLYGPPGTGKSYLAKAVATESDSTFFSVSSADLMSRWVGDSEKLVRTLFEMARKSSREQNATSIIFIDEIDSMCSARGDQESDATKRMKTEFLVQMQGVSNDDTDVLVLAATNIPWGLDSAIRRRFEKRIYIPLPDAAARAQMLRIHLGKTPHTLTEEDFTALAAEAEMYSGSDMHVLVRNAMMESIRTLQLATHFKYIRGPWTRPAERTDSDGTNATGDESTVSEKTDGVRPVCMMIVDDLLFPCAPNDPNGFPMELLSISDPSKVVAPSVCYADFLKAMRSARPSVCTEDLTQHLKFTQDFGQEG